MPQAAAPPRPRVVCKRSELSGGGTASMPVREKGRRSPGSQPARPFSPPPPRADRRQSAGLFAYSPRGSPLRQTGCWREKDSNPQPFARNPAFLRVLEPRLQPICTPILLHFAPFWQGNRAVAVGFSEGELRPS